MSVAVFFRKVPTMPIFSASLFSSAATLTYPLFAEKTIHGTSAGENSPALGAAISSTPITATTRSTLMPATTWFMGSGVMT